MNNFTFLKSLLVFSLFFAFQSFEAQVLWYGDPDLEVRDVFRRLDPDGNSNPTGDRCVDDENNPPTVSVLTDNEHGKYWRINKPVSRKRAEFARTTGDINSFVPQKGETYYYGWRWRITSEPNPSGEITVFQWKTDDGGNIDQNKQNYPFNMEYDGSILSLNAYGPAEPNWNRPGSITQRKTTLWRSAVAEDTWVSFVIRINVDDTFDNTNNRYMGYLEFWFNGEQQTLTNFDFNEYQVVLAESDTRAYHKTFDGIEVYPKWGSYNENACDLETNTDFNEMRIATTYEAALPSGTVSNPDTGLEGLYKIKNVMTGNYMTYNASDDNIYGSSDNGAENQLFRLVKNGNTGSGGDPLYNIDSEVSGVGVIRAENLNVFATTSMAPSTSNPNSFMVIDAGGGIYNFLANTSSSRYIAEDLDNADIKYTSSAVPRTEFVLEPQTLSSGDFNQEVVKLYPNPVNDRLYIKSSRLNISKIEIFDLSGKLVQRMDSSKDDGIVSIPVERLAKGLYILNIQGDNKRHTTKFIKL